MFQSKRLYHFVIFLILSGLIPIPSTVGAEASSSVVIAQIAASPLHALVLTESGEVYGWGSNANGALGDGTDEARTEDLTKAQGLPAIKAVSTGYLSSYALTNEGELYAWGRNYYGQLGGGASWGITLPRKIEGLPKLVQIEGGNEFAVALAASGEVYTFGVNSVGQLGDGTTVERSNPAKVPGLPFIKEISVGMHHTLALSESGEVYAWGSNNSGQLGDETTINRTSPVRITGLPKIKALSAGVYHTLALADNGDVYGWGSNEYGQLGQVSTDNVMTPNLIDTFPKSRAIAASASDSSVITTTGEVYVLGTVQNENSPSSNVPRKMEAVSGAETIASGSDYTLCVLNSGEVYGWGSNEYGQLLLGPSNKSMPVKLSEMNHISQISAGYHNTGVVSSSGELFAWGMNNYGQLGDGTTEDRGKPVLISNLPPLKKVEKGSDYTLAVSVDGIVYGWGSNYYGTIGDGTTINKTTPTWVKGLSNVKDVATAYFTSAALTENGEVYTWGLGYQQSPEILNGLPPISNITAGDDGTVMAVSEDGEVFMWGWISALGGFKSVPIKVDGLASIKNAAVGANATYAVSVSGEVYAWGSNDRGQLGDGTYESKSTPTLIQGLSGIISVSAGRGGHVHAMTQFGEVYEWGSDSNSDPISIRKLPFNEKISSISSKFSHTIALSTSGNLYVWGTNDYGEIGDGTRYSKVPTNLSSKIKNSILALPDNEPPYWPGNSTLQVSEVGSTEATLAWTPAVDNKEVSGYALFSIVGITLSEVAVVDHGITKYKLTNLTPDTQYTFMLKAKDGTSNWSDYSPEINFRTSPRGEDPGSGTPGSGTPGGGTPGSGTPSVDMPEESSDLPWDMSTSVMPNGKQSIQIQLKDNGLEELMRNDEFKSSKIFQITSSDRADRYKVTLPIKFLSGMSSLEASSLLRISTPDGWWQLPVSTLLKGLNVTASEPVVISIEHAGTEYEETLQQQLAGSGVRPLGKLLDFSVTVSNQPVNQFSEYAEHGLVVETKQIPLNQLAGLTYDPVAERFVPVPIKTEWNDGVLHVSLYKKGNSVYTVVMTEKASYQDVAVNSMYKASIEALSNRLVLKGFGDGTFKPEKSITRAEFAAILNRSLGILPGSDQSTSQFEDVKKGAWYEKDIDSAVFAGLITGYSPTSFKPDQTITHQEMIVMLVRAYEYVHADSVNATGIATPAALKLPEWFIPAYQKAIQEGILLSGGDPFTFHPAQTATRQESAYLLHRLLEILVFI